LTEFRIHQRLSGKGVANTLDQNSAAGAARVEKHLPPAYRFTMSKLDDLFLWLISSFCP